MADRCEQNTECGKVNSLTIPQEIGNTKANLIASCLHSLSPATRRVYAHHLSQFLDSGLPLNREGISEFAFSAKTPSVINQRLSSSKQLANESHARNLIDYPTLSAILSLKGKKQYGVRMGNWLNLAQCKALLNHVTGLSSFRDKALLSLLIGCGLRRSEAANLTLSHWQLREGRRVILDLVGKRGRVRTIPVPQWVNSNVQAWVTSSLFATTSNFILQSFTTDGIAKNCMTESGVWWVVTQCAHSIGLESIRPHDLRRTYAKISRLNGAPLDQLQASLGHSSITTTQLYVGDIQDLKHGPGDCWEI